MIKKGIALLCILSLVFTQGIFLNVTAVSDKTAPAYRSASPRNNQIGVLRNAKIKVNFSENVYSGKYFTSIKLVNLYSKKTVPVTVNITKKQLVISHTSLLGYNTLYALTIPAKAVKDKAGNLSKMTKTIKFRTRLKPDNARTSVCLANLRSMDGMIQTAAACGDTITSIADMVPMYLTRVPTCPSGGTYTFVAGTETLAPHVICSIPEHNLP
jgi:hypothetical protein